MPLYETESDRDTEHELMSCSVSQLGADDFAKVPMSYHLDYALLVGGYVKAFCEVKCRSTKYDTLLLGMLKVMKAQELIRSGHRCFLLIGWPDGNYIREFRIDDTVMYNIQMGGTHKRGDVNDIEPCVYFPLDEFERLI